jgi:hypothetical protein
MPIDINRRDALAKAFKLYPNVLDQFVIGHAELAEYTRGEGYIPVSEIETENAEMKIMQICMAQFCTRLVRTRAANSGNSALEEFSDKTVERYKDYQRQLVGARVILAPEKYRKALTTFENNMVKTILEALDTEVEIEVAAYHKRAEEIKNGPVPKMEEYDEASFWHDVFLSLTMNQAKHHPSWAHPVNRVVLDHIHDFKSALVPS